MRWYSALLLAVDEPTVQDLIGSEPVSDDGVQFDIGNNVIGNPDRGDTLSTGTIESVTFLSGGADPVSIAFNVINVALSFLGLLCVIFVLYAGYKWFTARENEEEVKKAKDILKGAVIGIAIVLMSLGLAQLLFNTLVDRTTVSLILPLLATPVSAQTPETLPFDPNEATGLGLGTIGMVDLGSADPVTVTISVINIILTLLGMGFLLVLLYAGALWVRARGNEEEIRKAKDTLKRSVIGLVIVLSAYGIASLVTTLIYERTLTPTEQAQITGS